VTRSKSVPYLSEIEQSAAMFSVTLTFNPLTSKVCGTSDLWYIGYHVIIVGGGYEWEIGQSAAELLMI